MKKRRSLLLAVLLFFTIYLSGQETKVMFLGNSYSFWNEMPAMFYQLAVANGDSLLVQGNLIGGYTLGIPGQGHLYNDASLDMIGRGIWDFVVLQEHSQFPVIPFYRDNYTFPAANSLNEIIQAENHCAQTVFFMTWGRKYGGEQCINSHCSPVFVDFFHMQDSLESAYMNMTLSNDAMCSPVGMCFAESIANGDPIELFDTDASHPSLAGSYLTACAFYASIFLKTPVGIEYSGGLLPADAAYLQQIAEDVILTNPAQWNIFPIEPYQVSFTYEIDESLAQFTNTTLDATAFYWDFGDPLSGSNNTSGLENPSHQYSHQGSYIVSLSAGDSCRTDLTTDTVVVIETGIREADDYRMTVFPNPVSDVVNVYLTDGMISSSYEIIGLDGKLYLNGNLVSQNGKAQIAGLSVLSPGVYVLQISGSSQRSQRKIIISP